MQTLASSRRVRLPSRGEQRLSPLVARAQPVPQATSAATSLVVPPQLDAAVKELIAKVNEKGVKGKVSKEDVEAELGKISSLSRELGFNRVTEELTCGLFKGYMTTDIKQASLLTLGRLTFNQLHPNDTQAKLDVKDELGLGDILTYPDQWRGHFEGCEDNNAYVVPSYFRIVGGEADGLCGVSYAMGAFELNQEETDKLNITFLGLRIEPVKEQPDFPAKLELWKAFFGAHNPGMDPTTGRITINIAKPPKGWLRFHVFSSSYQLTEGNMGTFVLMERMADN